MACTDAELFCQVNNNNLESLAVGLWATWTWHLHVACTLQQDAHDLTLGLSKHGKHGWHARSRGIRFSTPRHRHGLATYTLLFLLQVQPVRMETRLPDLLASLRGPTRQGGEVHCWPDSLTEVTNPPA